MFVSHAALASEQARANALHEEVSYLRQQNAMLLSHALTPAKPVTTSTVQRVQARASDPVSEAIATAAGSNAVLRRQLGVYAKQQRTGKVPESDIVSSILNWQDVDED